MIFHETAIPGVFIIDPERNEDARGFFARLWCGEEFADHGLMHEFAQCSTSFNHRRGTLRGLHFQAPPHAEAKLVRCTQGAIFDVAVDLRPQSARRGAWQAAELSARNGRMLYIPAGCAHGFQTLADDSEVFYQITPRWRPEAASGIRWDDPAIGIDWPIPEPILSERDRVLPGLDELQQATMVSAC